MRFLSMIDWGRIAKVLVLPNLAFLVLALLTNAPPLIASLNLVLISMSVGVCVAFLPNVARAFTRGEPLDSESIICLGIFAAWSDWAFRAGLSLVWRFFPSLKWTIDSDINSWILFIALYAAACHLAAPAIINGRIPSRRWVRIGITAGIGVLAGLLLIYWPEMVASFHTGERLTAPQPTSFSGRVI